MCGRICLTLEINDIQIACKYKNYKKINKNNNKKNDDNNKNDSNSKNNQNEVEKIPEYRFEYNLGKQYHPSYNVCPTKITPVLISAKHIYSNDDCDDDDESKMENDDRILIPMMWGMIPFWHKGDYRKHGLTTNNCRLEHMLESKLFKKPFLKGQRCVVLCEGFYEWQTTKSAKPSERFVYFIHSKQNDSIKIYDKSTWNNSNINLLKMAGVFDIWEDSNKDKMYSYSIITFESNETLSWLHHRMPAILETDEQVSNWLNIGKIPEKEVLSTLKQTPKNLAWYQVSNFVNNTKNQFEDCNKPITCVKKNKVPANKIMQAWLLTRKRKEDSLNEKLDSDDTDDEDNLNNDKNLQQSSKLKNQKLNT